MSSAEFHLNRSSIKSRLVNLLPAWLRCHIPGSAVEDQLLAQRFRGEELEVFHGQEEAAQTSRPPPAEHAGAS